MENVCDILFLLMKHGTNTLHDPFILLFSGDGNILRKGEGEEMRRRIHFRLFSCAPRLWQDDQPCDPIS